MSKKTLSGPGAALLASLVISSTAFSAVDLSTIAGDWRVVSVTNPNGLRETYFNSTTGQNRQSVDSSDHAGRTGLPEELVDVFFAGVFNTFGGDFALSAQGAVTGSVAGSLRVTASGTVTGNLDGGPVNLNLNASGDVMLTALRDDDDHELILVVKRPTGAVLADLAGTWNFVDLGTPTELTKNDINGDVSDVFFRGGFEAESAAVMVTAGGAISGAVTGSGSTTADGTVTLDFGEGPIA